MEKKKINSREPMELDDEMLEGVAGGMTFQIRTQRSQSDLTRNTSNIDAPSTGFRRPTSCSTPGTVTNASTGIQILSSDEVVIENEQQEE